MSAAGRAPLSPMSRQPSFASPAQTQPTSDLHHNIRMWLAHPDAENVDPNVDKAASRTQSRAGTDSTFPSTLRTSSVSSSTKRQIEVEVEAVVEKRLRKEYDKRLAEEVGLRKEYDKRLAEEVKKRVAAELVAEAAMSRYHKRRRELTRWRLRAHRAKSALRNSWVRREDGTSTRARRVLVQKGGKRCAIQHQVVFQSGSLRCRQGGVGGTEYTTKERLLAFQQDLERGIGSRHESSARSNAERLRRQDEVWAVMHARTGYSSRRHNSTIPVDPFAQPKERAMKETRMAIHMLACREFVQKSKRAVALNLSADGKQYGQFPTIGADVDLIMAELDKSSPDVFGNCPTVYKTFKFRPPIMQLPSKSVIEKSLVRRKDGGQYESQTALKLAIMLMVSGVSIAMSTNSGAVRFATDAAADNRGEGPQDETMQHMSGRNSLMDRLMIRGDVWNDAEAYLASLGLLEPIHQLINSKDSDKTDLHKVLKELTEKRLARERIEKWNAKGRAAAKRALQNIAEGLAEEANKARVHAADLALIQEKLIQANSHGAGLSQAKDELKAAEDKAREAKDAALSAKRRAKEAGRRCGAPSDSTAARAGCEAAVVPAAAAAVATPRLQRVQLDMSGPVPKCPEEQERLFQLKMYEARLRPVLKRQRFWRWIWNMWLYTANEQRLQRPRAGQTPAEVELQKRMRLKRMRQIDARNKALYGACDTDGNACSDWRALLEDVLPEVEALLKPYWLQLAQRGESVSDSDSVSMTDDETAEELPESEVMNDEARWSRILKEEHDPVKFSNGARCCGKGLAKERADAKISRALLRASKSAQANTDYMRRACLFWFRFWKPRPTKPAHGVSMGKNPCRFWVCVNHLPDGAASGQRCEAGTAGHCKEHRVCNFGKKLFRSLDPGVTVNLGVVAHAVHSNDLGIGLSDAVDAMLRPDLAANPHTDFHAKVRAAVNTQHAEKKGLSMDEAIRQSGVKIKQGQEVKLEIDKPNEARWISIFKLADDVSRAENWLATGVLRAKGVSDDEGAEVSAAAAIFSYRGFVPDDHPTLDIDPSKRHLFRILVSPQAKESRYMMAAVYQLVLHPLLALTGDIKSCAKMMGVRGLPRRLLQVIQHVIWMSTAPREVKNAMAHRTDAEIRYKFAKDSMRFINPKCGDAIRRIIGNDLPESLLDAMVDSIPTLLRRMRHLAMTPGRVVPDTTRLIFAFMFGYLYNCDGSLKDKDGKEVKETFPIKMSQMQLHFRMMIKDAEFEVRKAMAREISSPLSFASGASWEVSSRGTVNDKHILSPHPDALANVVVLRAMGRDIVAHMKNQLHAKQGDLADQHPLDFLPAIAFMWSQNGTKSSIAFTGMADPAKFEFKNSCDQTHDLEENGPVEPSMLQGMPISSLVDGGGADSHWQSVASFSQFAPVLSQTRMAVLFPRPIQNYPYLNQLVVLAATASNSSKGVETNWGVLSMFHNTRTNLSFGSLREQYTNQNGVTMGLDLKAIEEDDIGFRLGLEIARLPGWRTFDGADRLLRESMHADYKHAQAVKKGKRSCSESTLNGSYRGDRWVGLTASEKTAVLNKTLCICAINGFEYDPIKVASFRQQLGLPPSTARPQRRRAQRKRQEAENLEHQLSPSPPPSPHHDASIPSPPATARSPPSPPQPQQPAPPPAAADPALVPSPLQSLSDGRRASLGDGNGDGTNSAEGGVGSQGEDGNGDDESDLDIPLASRLHHQHTETRLIDPRLAGTRGDGDGVAHDEGDGDDDESEDSKESDIEYADNSLDENTHSLAFVYDTFNACTPYHPKNSDNIWLHSNVHFRAHLGMTTASVTRRPTEHLRRLLTTFDPIPTAGMQFTVHRNCQFLRYILRQSWSGCVIVKVETFSQPEGDDWSKTAQVRRVMTTEHAIKECQARTNEGVHLGKPALVAFQTRLEEFQRNERPWTVGFEVYHESDVLEDADIRELIGVVRSYPFNVLEAPEQNHFKSPYDYDTADLIYIGAPFRLTIRRTQKRVVDRPAGDAGGAAGTRQGTNVRGPGRGRVTSAGGNARGRAGGSRRAGLAGSKPGNAMEDSDDDDPLFRAGLGAAPGLQSQ